MNLVDQPAHDREMAAHDAVKCVPNFREIRNALACHACWRSWKLRLLHAHAGCPAGRKPIAAAKKIR